MRRLSRPSVFGSGLPERLRSTSLALLGLTAAAGLGLVAFALHQGWPVAPDLPIPGVPFEAEVGHGRPVITEPAPSKVVKGRRSGATVGDRSSPADAGPASSDSRLAAVDVVAAPTAAPVPNSASPDAEQPSGGGSPEPSPGRPPPAAVPAVPPSPAPGGSSPSSRSSLGARSDEDDEDEQDDEDDEDERGEDDTDEAAEKGRGHSKGDWQRKAPSRPKAKEGAPEQSPPDYEGELDEDEVDEDESTGSDDGSDGRGRSRGHRDR